MEYAAYNMRSYFHKQPGQPTCCAECGQALSMSDIGPSAVVAEDMRADSLIPVHQYSLLFVCQQCGWWCIRESWDFCEISGEYDCIVVGTGKRPQAQEEARPWMEALKDPNLYQFAGALPERLARIFPRGERKTGF